MSNSTKNLDKKRGSGGLVAALLVLLLAGYVGSYIGLSRRGFSYARSCAKTCFYFFPPASGAEGLNFTCVRLYYPLIVIDNMLGTGMPAASEDDWRHEANFPFNDA